MDSSEEQVLPPVGARAPLHKAALTGLALAAALCCGTAGAETYTLTTTTTGTAGNFFLDGLFPQGEINGFGDYQLTVTSRFGSDSITTSADHRWMSAEKAALSVALRVDERTYHLDAVGTVSSTILSDTDSNGVTVKRFYNNISFDPSTKGDLATIQQYVFLGADQFAIGSVLEPAMAYYANPLVKGFEMHDWAVGPKGSLELLGDASGRADTFEYNLSAVPEPATWGMLGAGLAVAGFAARRRRQPSASA